MLGVLTLKLTLNQNSQERTAVNTVLGYVYMAQCNTVEKLHYVN